MKLLTRQSNPYKETIKYVVKMNSPDIRSEFSYDQFVNLSHSECVELMMKPGGPSKYPYEKTKQQYS